MKVKKKILSIKFHIFLFYFPGVAIGEHRECYHIKPSELQPSPAGIHNKGNITLIE